MKMRLNVIALERQIDGESQTNASTIEPLWDVSPVSSYVCLMLRKLYLLPTEIKSWVHETPIDRIANLEKPQEDMEDCVGRWKTDDYQMMRRIDGWQAGKTINANLCKR